MNKVYGYLRVSTDEQDNSKFKLEVLDYANRNKMGTVLFIEEKISGTVDWQSRQLGQIINNAERGDVIITPELSRLSRSIKGIYDIVDACQKQGVELHILKQNLIVKSTPDMTTKVMINCFAMMADMEREFVSLRTKEALKAKQQAGVKLGRPRGSFSSKLDVYADEIKAFKANGASDVWIAKKYGVSSQTVANWRKNNDVK